MATNSYLCSEFTLTRQEGDTGSIVIELPVLITLSEFTEVIFQAFRGGVAFIDKRLSNSTSELTVVGQQIIVELTPADTVGYKGTNKYECQISGNPAGEVITIVKGDLVIVKEYITENS